MWIAMSAPGDTTLDYVISRLDFPNVMLNVNFPVDDISIRL